MPELDYREEHKDEYEPKAAATFKPELLPNSKSPSIIVVTGPCPRCDHGMTFPHHLLIVRGVDEIDDAMAEGLWDIIRGNGEEPESWEFDGICDCHVKHPSAPDDATGCGGYWRMKVARKAKDAEA